MFAFDVREFDIHVNDQKRLQFEMILGIARDDFKLRMISI